MYYVVDQNLLRRWASVQQFLDESPANQCVLPDAAFLEMTQNEKWEDTLRNSLRCLALVPERVHAAYAVSEALYRELDSLKAVKHHMLCRAATSHIRKVLSWVRTGQENDALRQIRAMPTHADTSLMGDHFDHARNKEALADHFDLVWRQLSPDFQKSLRKPVTTDEDRLDAVHQLAKSVAYDVLLERGVNRNRARVFLQKRPMFYRYFIVKVWNAMDWLCAGGLDGLSEKNATNERLDHHYTLTASFFDGVLTNDDKVRRSYTALGAVLVREV